MDDRNDRLVHYGESIASVIERAADGEPVEWIVFGEGYDGNMRPTMGRMMTWQDAQPIVNEPGGARVHCFYAWTDTWIIFESQYDGTISFERIPRNPITCMPPAICMPTMPGN